MKLKLPTLLWHALSWFVLSCGLYAQEISAPTVNSGGGPLSISFNITNGAGLAAHFSPATQFFVYLSDASGSNFSVVHVFSSPVSPSPSNGASATVSEVIQIPFGTPVGAGYRILVTSSAPSSGMVSAGNASAPFALSAGISMPGTLNGYIKCSSPSINYYVLTVTNNGNFADSYALSATQSLYPLGMQLLSLSGVGISSTPVLGPGETFTFMIKFDTPNGTPPNNWNSAVVTSTSQTQPNVSASTNISTFIYCGNLPSNQNVPDMTIVKTANIVTADVGDFIDYTITIRNNRPKNAVNPAIKDFLPGNVQLISYNKAPGETRNVTFAHNPATNSLTAVVNATMTNASPPLTINVRVRTTCYSVPMVVNSAEVYTSSGDIDSSNDSASATTSVGHSVSGGSIGRWTGAYSSDWFDCRNWTAGVVPTNATHVIIPVSAASPQIDRNSPFAPSDKIARCYDMTIDAAGSLGIVNQSRLFVAGNWSSSGNFQAGDGEVIFMTGASGTFQTISDTTGRIEFYDIVIDPVTGGRGLWVSDGLGLIVHNDLDLLSGDIRLFGKSQLVQTRPGASTNTIAGSGSLMVDQQGQTNMFSYNYWSSPVGSNNSYTVGQVLRDGTDPLNPQPITWTPSYNTVATTPITLSSYWINKYQNQSGNYANWSAIGQNGVLSAGQGFTLKGSAAPAPQQNYTFIGKPNNGEFISAVSANNMNLSGNPYPSALDAYAFIDDNQATTTGTLYFWEQFSTNSSHVTANYEGGYATLTKTGATPPAAPEGISTSGSSNRIPGRYVPIGQGFLLFGSETGGEIKFRNTQRAFVRESDPLSNPMFRADDQERKLRIGFAGAHSKRQLLLGFMGDVADDTFNYGYDAIQIDTRSNDIYFPLADKKLVIEAKGEFSESVIVPLGVKITDAGSFSFSLDALDGFATGTKVFLWDAHSGTNRELTSQGVSLDLQPGEYTDRFSIRFTGGRDESPQTGIWIAHADGSLSIHNPNEIRINSVEVMNVAGMRIFSTRLADDSSALSVPLGKLAHGIYFARISTKSGDVVKKFILR